MPLFWWMRRRSYVIFVLRELTSVFVAWFVVYLLLLVRAVARGAAAYQEFLDGMAQPVDARAQRGRARLRAAARGHLLQPGPAGDGRTAARPAGAAARLVAGVYLGWLVVTAFLAWLVLG